MIVGYLLAACAALASGTGSVPESIGIRRVGIFGGTSFDLVRLRKQYGYFLGLCADLTGFVLAAAALRLLPLFLVQSVIAFSVGVTAVISALLGIRLAGLGWIALAVGAGGLLLLGLSAEPTPAHTLPPGWGWTLPMAVVPLAALGYLGRKMPPRVATPMLAFAAGLGFSVVGIAASHPCTYRIRPVNSCNRDCWRSSSTVPWPPPCSPCLCSGAEPLGRLGRLRSCSPPP